MIEVLLATPRTLGFGLAVALPTVAFAALLGGWAGYRGGWPAQLLDLVADLLLATPRLVVLLLVIGMFRRTEWWSLWSLAALLGLLGWGGLYRLVAAQARSIRQRPWVEAGEGLGLSQRVVFWRHVLPHCLGPVRAQLVPIVGHAILAQAVLAWLGLEDRSADTWGGLIARARPHMLNEPEALWMPVLAVAAVTALGQVLINREDG